MRIHQGVIWNYFRQRRSVLIAFFSLVLKKKKKKLCPVPFWFICSSPLTRSRFALSFNKFAPLEPTDNCLYIVAAQCGGEQTGFWAGNQKWNRVSLPVGSDTGPSVQDDAGWQEKSKKLEQIQRLQKQVACLFSLLAAACLMFSTAENFLIQPVVPLSDRLGHDKNYCWTPTL